MRPPAQHERIGLAEALFNESADALFLVDPESDQLLDVNPVAVRLSGFSREELLRMTAGSLFRSEFHGGRERLRQAAGKSGAFHSQEGYLLRTSRDEVWVAVNLSISRLHVRPRTLALITARDVTEQREADRRLRRLESELGRLTASIAACLWSADIDPRGQWRYRHWSPVVERVTGQPPAFFREGPRCWESIVYAEDRPAWAQSLRGWQEGRSGSLEYRVVRPDGSVRWLHEDVIAARMPEGGLRLDAVVTDVTERREAERERQEQRTFLEQLIAHIPCAVFWKDRDCVYLGCNVQSARDLGLSSPAEVVGRTDRDLQPDPDEADFYVRCDREVMASGRALSNIEETQRRRDGTRAVLLTSKVPLRSADGQVVGMLGIYTDITERKSAEDLVRGRERLFRAVIEAAGAVPYTRDYASNGFAYVGPGIEALLGFTPEEFTPQRWTSLVREIIPFGVRRGLLLEEARRLFREDPSPSWWGDFRVVNAAGEERWLFNACAKTFGTRGEVVGTWGLLQDITERKRQEERLGQAQKMEAVGQLAGGVAHDFNNLLTIIQGYTDLLLSGLPENASEHGHARQVLKAAERATELTGQLLAFGRRAMIVPRPLDLNHLLGEMARMLGPLLGEDVELVLRLGEGLGYVLADPGQIHQVVVNLVVNARDAMPTGGRLIVATRNADLADGRTCGGSEVRPGPYVLLEISDSGCGMDEETRARIFEPFFTTKGLGRGTGLGLAVVHGIVHQGGGHIEVSSAAGRGSTFRAYLPRVGAAPRPLDPEPARPALPGGSETVLVVEDEEGVRALTRHVLEACGYRILAASNGTEAVEVARRHEGTIDLLLTDVVMPHGNGRELVGWLSASKPGLKVLFLSGYPEDEVVRRGVSRAEAAFLQKPFGPATLALKVREVLDRQAAGDGQPPAQGGRDVTDRA